MSGKKKTKTKCKKKKTPVNVRPKKTFGIYNLMPAEKMDTYGLNPMF